MTKAVARDIVNTEEIFGARKHWSRKKTIKKYTNIKNWLAHCYSIKKKQNCNKGEFNSNITVDLNLLNNNDKVSTQPKSKQAGRPKLSSYSIVTQRKFKLKKEVFMKEGWTSKCKEKTSREFAHMHYLSLKKKKTIHLSCQTAPVP